MIGDEYFQVRAQLGTALFSLQTLAHELHARRQISRELQNMSGSLRESFLFVVVGEAKSGKSSLVNAIFGRELCRTEVAEPGTIHIFKYGPHEKDIPVSEWVTECERPIFLLRDFNVVDTPDAVSICTSPPEVLTQILAIADLILVVFSATSPWNEATWDCVKPLPADRFRSVIFILQQADLRTPLEVDAFVQHLKQTAVEKLGLEVPVFAISAKKGYLAKTVGVDKERLLAESGFDRLESYINQAITRGDERWGSLRAVCERAQEILHELGVQVREAFHNLELEEQKLTELNGTLEDRKQQSLRQVHGELWTLAQTHEHAQKRSEEMLSLDLSPGGMLRLAFQNSRWERNFLTNGEGGLLATMQQRISSSIDILETDLKKLWVEINSALRNSFTRETRSEAAPPALVGKRGELLDKINLILLQQAKETQFGDQIATLFEKTRQWLRVMSAVFAAAVLLTLIAAALGGRAVALVGGAVAILSIILGASVALFRRRQILRRFHATMLQRREDFLGPVEDHLRDAIELFYRQLHVPFEPLRNYAAMQRKIYEPIIVRVEQLEETLRKCAANLGLGRI